MKICKIAVIYLALMLAFTTGAMAEIQKMNLKWANFLPESFSFSKVDTYFAQEIEKRTEGKVKINVFHGGTLGKVGEIPKLVSSGAIEVGNFPASYFFSQFPMSTAIAIPMLTFNDLAATQLALKLSKHPIFLEEKKRNNLHPFLFGGLAPYRLIAHKQLASISDLKDLKVRSYGSLFPVVFKSLGVVPVNIPVTEVYESLQRNVIDCAFADYSGMKQFRLNEVAKQISTINFGSVGKYLTYVNLDLWNKWPQELRDIWNEVNEEAQKFSHELTVELEKKSLDEMLASGANLVTFQEQKKMQQAVPDMIDEWVAQAERAGHGENARIFAQYLRKCLRELEKND